MNYVKKARTFLEMAEITISGAWIDCGCGHGSYAEALAICGAHPVIAIDSRIPTLARILPPVLVCNSDCGFLPVKNESVSGFLYVNVLHYYKTPNFLIQEACRVLKDTGYLVIIEYNQSGSTAWNPYPLTADTLTHLLRTDFDLVKRTVVDTRYRPKHLVVGKKRR
jgi:ubiquinone/menaquinone biosynthesis C-methylase UbiE